MTFHFVESIPKLPALVIHGGAGERFKDLEYAKNVRVALADIVRKNFSLLLAGESAGAVCRSAILELEDCGLFNAGRGSALQIDGIARRSASCMDGSKSRFSSVSLVTHEPNPSVLAFELQNRIDRNLGPLGAQLLARELGRAPQNIVAPTAAKQWVEAFGDEGTVISSEFRTGTVGAVAIDLEGDFFASTSTGGYSSFPERASDVVTPAGNFASRACAVSASGIGEDIIDASLASRLETRVRDGKALPEASERCQLEAAESKQLFGWIALSRDALVASGTTEQIAACAAVSSREPMFFFQ